MNCPTNIEAAGEILSVKLNCLTTRLSPPRRARLALPGSAAVSAAPVGARMCLARGEHEPQASGKRFRRRDSVWSAATRRRFFPRAQAKPPGIRPCREQKRQQAGALQTLARDTGGGVQGPASGQNPTQTDTGAPSPTGVLSAHEHEQTPNVVRCFARIHTNCVFSRMLPGGDASAARSPMGHCAPT